MKTRNIVIIIVLLVLIGIGAWFLLGGQEWLTPTDGEGEEEGVEEGEEEETELLTDILAKTVGIASFKYDMVATTPGQAAVTMKMWRKGMKMKMEGTFEGQNMVYLVDMDTEVAYMYVPAENTAIKIGLGTVQETVGDSPAEQSEFIMKYDPVVVGTEILDGKSCLVIEYTTETADVKMWLWKRYGLPIKTESTTEIEGTSVIELKNIDFSNIPDNIFELPAGVQIMELPF